jgi:hypothetical protein
VRAAGAAWALLAALALALLPAGCGGRGAGKGAAGPPGGRPAWYHHAGASGGYSIEFPKKPEQAVEETPASGIALLEILMYTDQPAQRVYGVLAVHRGNGRVISAEPAQLFDALQGTIGDTFKVRSSGARDIQIAGLPGREVDLIGIENPEMRGLGRFAVDDEGGDLFVLLAIDADAGSSPEAARFFASFALTPR